MNENKTLEQLNAKSGGFYYASTIAIYVMLSFLGQALMSALAEKTSVVPRANAPRLETSTPFARFVMVGSRPSSIPV